MYQGSRSAGVCPSWGHNPVHHKGETNNHTHSQLGTILTTTIELQISLTCWGCGRGLQRSHARTGRRRWWESNPQPDGC